METSENKLLQPAPSRSLREALREARIREAESLDQSADRRSTELARLEVLKAELEELFEELPESDDRFALMLVPSTPARLWVDLFCAVVYEPSTEVYRLVHNGRQGRKVLAETADVGDMADRIVDYVAQQIMARERELEGRVEPRLPERPRSRAGLAVSAFVIGLLTGAAGLLAIGYLITS